MKRILIILSILFLALPAWAEEPYQVARMNLGIVGGGVPAAGGTVEVGNTTIEDTSGAVGIAYLRGSGIFTAPVTGTLDRIYLYGSNSDADLDITFGIYTGTVNSPGAIVGTVTAFTDTGTWSLGWKEFTVSYSVTNDSVYWISWENSAPYTGYWHDEVTGIYSFYFEHTYGNAWPDPMNEDGVEAGHTSVKARISY